MKNGYKWLLCRRRHDGARGWLVPGTASVAWMVGVVCLGGAGPAPAEEGPAGMGPPVANAVAEIDADVNVWLARAVAAIRAGNPDNALPLLVRLVRSDPATMGSTNGATYLSARKLAIELIRTLPEQNLAAYRLQADVSAKNLAGRAPPTDIATLEALRRNSLPDAATAEAGLCLAGLYLDQGRFVAARRVLLGLLDEYAQEHVARSELLARLVVACARVGDAARADWAWAELQKEGPANRWSFLAAELRPPAPPETSASNAWTMAYGGPSREGASPLSGPEQGGVDSWIPLWGLNLGPGMVRGGLNAEGSAKLPPQYSVARGYAAMSMTDGNHRPSDDVVFAGNRAWINGFGECVAVDLDSGRAIHRTAHDTDDPAKDPPGAADGFWVFANRLNRAASLIGEGVYCVEDNYRSTLKPNLLERRVRVEGKETFRPLPCGNALAAYEADTGRRRWRIGREPPTETPVNPRSRWQANAVRFTGAPVPCAGLLLVPLEDDSGPGVAGLDADSGALVWRTRLTSKFASAAPRAAPVNVTVDGAYAYVCGGKGSLSAVDGYDGTVQWTALYEPLPSSPATNLATYDGTVLWTNFYEPFYVSSTTIPVSREIKPETLWEESLTLVVGESVVAMPEDSGEILAFDRRNGMPLWRQRKPEGVNYVVGRRGPRLIVAGQRTVACVDLTDGRERWRTAIEGSTGRGALYGQEVLIPRDRRILRLRIEDGVALASTRAKTMDGLPLGNLYVKGNRLLVAGLERLYALGDARPVLARLEERLTRQPTAEAYAERGGLYADIERYPEAVADLREAWKRQRGSAGKAAARGALLTALWSAAGQEPGAAESLFTEALEIAVTVTERAETMWRWARCREQAGNTSGALSLCAALASAPVTSMAPAPGETDWEVSAQQLAGHRIRTRLAGDAAQGWALLEEPAAHALAALSPAAKCSDLVAVATVFPGTLAGRNAAIKASQLAAGRGDLGTAEVILQRALVLSTPSNRVVVADHLVRLYEKMGLARVAANAVGVPPPPWRLRWQKRLQDGTEFRQVAAGLFYWNAGAKHTGCLDPETGKARWQKDGVLSTLPGYATSEDSHLLLVFTGDSAACVDVWSGAVVTNALFRGTWEWLRDSGGHDHSPLTLSPIGLATVNPPRSYADLAGVDLLTGKVAWRRGDMDTLLDWLMWSIPVSSSAESVVLMTLQTDETRVVVSLDPWTGAVTGRRSFEQGVFEDWAQRMSSRSGSEDPFALDRGNPVLENRRLTVKNLRTGATIWRSAPDIAILKYSILPGGTVVALCDAEELLLLSGEDGHTLFRSEGVRFVFDHASVIGGAILAVRETADGAREGMVIDPVKSRIIFQGRLPPGTTPLRAFGAGMPDHVLASVESGDSRWLQVVNGRGEEARDWRLPRSEDIRRAQRGRYYPLFVDGLILMVGDSLVLAYEHDPGDREKRQ